MTPNHPTADRLERIESLLREVLDSANAPTKRFFSVASAADYSDLSQESIRRLLSSGKLTAMRPVRGKILIDQRELDQLILTSTTRPRTGRGMASRKN